MTEQRLSITKTQTSLLIHSILWNNPSKSIKLQFHNITIMYWIYKKVMPIKNSWASPEVLNSCKALHLKNSNLKWQFCFTICTFCLISRKSSCCMAYYIFSKCPPFSLVTSGKLPCCAAQEKTQIFNHLTVWLKRVLYLQEVRGCHNNKAAFLHAKSTLETSTQLSPWCQRRGWLIPTMMMMMRRTLTMKTQLNSMLLKLMRILLMTSPGSMLGNLGIKDPLWGLVRIIIIALGCNELVDALLVVTWRLGYHYMVCLPWVVNNRALNRGAWEVTLFNFSLAFVVLHLYCCCKKMIEVAVPWSNVPSFSCVLKEKNLQD